MPLHVAVIEASPNPIIAVDATGRITYVNPQVETTFGYARDELIDRPVEILLPERIAERHVAHRDAFLSQPNARPMGIGLDLAGRRKDGTEFPVEISLSPVETEQGLQVFATVVDISARKAADMALATSERRFRAVLEASPNVIIAVDEGGSIVYANPQTTTTFGYDRDEVVGQPLSLLLPERVRKRHADHRRRYMEQAIARPMGIGLDLSGRRKDGREFPVEISLSPVDTEDGRQVFATVVDITARKFAENQLLQAQKLESIGRLAGGIAHDFNNMLFAIGGYTELLMQDLAEDREAEFDPAAARSSVNAIAQAAERAGVLTSQLLAFSRQQVVVPRVVDLTESVRALEPILHRLIGENVHLTLNLDDRAGRIMVDAGQLDQILVNLVLNARDAISKGGTIVVETSNVLFDEPYAIEHFDVDPGSYVMLAVADTGRGMDQQTREHIFEPFFTTKDIGKGTGLGLATIYGVVRQAGGHIWLYSEPGRGTTFKLYFPRTDAPAEDVIASPPVDASTRTGAILVVEDETAVRAVTTQLLRRAGYTVVAVPDADQALRYLAETPERIDTLVTDVVMPGTSGIELAERVLDTYPHVGVVLLSGYMAETLDTHRVTDRGAQFLSKPAGRAELLAAVASALSAASTTG